jgi:hypothetical protein
MVMKVIIAGGRDLTDMSVCEEAMQRAIDSGITPTEIVSGGARGADALGEQWAHSHGITVRVFPADWKTHGRFAGPLRNREMALYADALVALPGGKGTMNMIYQAIEHGLTVFYSVRLPPMQSNVEIEV